ncbi:hypothetical protein [Serinibacter salmoneus]|uniref:Uncharacterized protein n=1 Tax=Serinibacter salmoneus TaxID=556530 RepID=A0A2A9CXX2_9MICO|nr:hypothetical protein [Serinibacter salmoneus]PFG19288.1 hypothetical protein ATL40_0846 [Serinibacter salmoneus]
MEWRFCGMFNYRLQSAVPDDRWLGWIDEGEARRRFHVPGERLTLVPPVDEATGIVPFFITVTPREHPSFTVSRQEAVAPGVGVVTSQSWWRHAEEGDRLFQHIAEVWEFGEYNPELPVAAHRAVRRWDAFNNEDGTGRVEEHDLVAKTFTKARRMDVPVADLYLPVPAWGEWESLV